MPDQISELLAESQVEEVRKLLQSGAKLSDSDSQSSLRDDQQTDLGGRQQQVSVSASGQMPAGRDLLDAKVAEVRRLLESGTPPEYTPARRSPGPRASAKASARASARAKYAPPEKVAGAEASARAKYASPENVARVKELVARARYKQEQEKDVLPQRRQREVASARRYTERGPVVKQAQQPAPTGSPIMMFAR